MNFVELVGCKVMEKLLAFLDPQNLLTIRKVCKGWNLVIHKNPELLWRKLRLLLQQNGPKSISDINRFLKMSQSLKCPNYHFKEIDLIIVPDFIKSKLIVINHLKLTKTNYSVPNLYQILMVCPCLEYLELVGIPMETTSLKDKWPLFRRHPVIVMARLKVLILMAENGSNLKQSTKVFNLSPGLLATVINSANLLESVKISGFGSWTYETLIQILVFDTQFGNLKELVFENIDKRHGLSNKSIRKNGFLAILKQLNYIQLRKLVISYNKNMCLQETQELSLEMGELLEVFKYFLEDLTIINYPVSEEIFQSTMPNLRKITLDILPLRRSTMKLKIQEFLPKLQFLQINNSYNISIYSDKKGKGKHLSISHLPESDAYGLYMQGIQNLHKFKPSGRLQVYKLILLILVGLFIIQMISYIFPPGWKDQIVILGHVGIVFVHLLYKDRQWQKRK